MHRRDRGGRELRVGVVCLDGGIVPRLDLAFEDAADDLRSEVQCGDAGKVEDDGDGADVDGNFNDGTLAGCLGLGQFGVVKEGVRAGKLEAAGDELLAAAARTHRVIVDRRIGVGGLESLFPGGDGRLLGTGAAGVKRARQFGRSGGVR